MRLDRTEGYLDRYCLHNHLLPSFVPSIYRRRLLILRRTDPSSKSKHCRELEKAVSNFPSLVAIALILPPHSYRDIYITTLVYIILSSIAYSRVFF